MLVLYF